MDNLSSLESTDCSKGNSEASMSSSELRRSRCRLEGFVLMGTFGVPVLFADEEPSTWPTKGN
ncbi:hypothetical protein TYRP_012293 [Tyrophagus putrescentiae]|nr:hypothetical protein TYRP_012293 [Tyrophagus putrescentiae]